jgi:hypothetical protein
MSVAPADDVVAPPPLSVHTVTSNLAQYDRREVTIKGVLTIQRENRSIAEVVCEEDGKAALWILFHHGSLGTRERDVRSFHNQIAIVTGIVDRQRKGHFGRFAATLTVRQMTLL